MEKDVFKERIQSFLKSSLPTGRQEDIGFVSEALESVASRYDRYARNKASWESFAARRGSLSQISAGANLLGQKLLKLDVLSWDDLGVRIQTERLEAIVGLLVLLSKEAKVLEMGVQSDGRPRDLAEERWVKEIADIFEKAFKAEAKVYGSSEKPRGAFYELLKLCRPPSFARHGKLSARQIRRYLAERARQRTGVDLSEARR
jgi:hypothetical protein